ncbi:hypothetical protein EGM51_00255 [Verrucomicrobia bacterium S94]|nr:hypothetical protein EGM51_00255 [Verrucomicrobia bacterium S94]
MKKTVFGIFSVVLPLAVMFSGSSFAESVDVEVNLNVKRSVGGVDSFDRSRFITIHSSHTDGDWGDRYGPNFTNDVLADFVLGNDVYFGRDTGYITGQLRNVIEEDPDKPGWARVTGSTWSMDHQGQYQRNNYNAKTSIHAYEDRLDGYVIGAQFRPFWPDGTLTGNADKFSRWALSQADTEAEPFGSASGNYMGHFMNYFYGSDTQVGHPLPTYVEVMNEPDWPLFESPSDPAYGTSSPEELWRYHNTVADQIRSLNTHVLIGGYCPAFADLEKDNFGEWQDEWISFINTCATNMDFYTLHFYDTDSSGSSLIRRGSHTEAMFDMIEHYTQIRVGKQVPFIVTEYAGKDTALQQQGWSPLLDWKRIKSMSGYLMSFMDRPNLVLKAIPYIMIKQEWARNATTGIPGSARLMRQADEPASYTGDWVYTEHIKWYQLWGDVKGIRADIVSSDPDIQADAYIDSEKAYVILNNLTKSDQIIDLTLFEHHGNSVVSVREKNLYWDAASTNVALDDIVHAGNLSQVQLGSEGTAILEYTFTEPVVMDQTSDEVKYYATTYFQPITNDLANVFTFTNVNVGTHGEAVLRLSAGRDRTLSKRPTVLFNGVPLPVPTDFMGHEGDSRTIFFGALEIPVPYSLLQSSNTVSVTYPDTGGYIGSVTLRTFEFSTDLRSLLYDIPVDWLHVADSSLRLGFEAGPTNSYFTLLSSTNLSGGSWSVAQTELPTDHLGDGAVTNPIQYASEFFRLVESDSPQPTNAPPPEPISIGFTAPDYIDGPLDGQKIWNAESGWTVGDTIGSGYASTPDNASAAVMTNAVQLEVGESYSLSINFQFGGSYSQPTNYVYAFLSGLKDSEAGVSVGTGSEAADVNLQIYGGDEKYRLLNNWSTISGCSTVLGQLDAGDILQFDYTLTMGSDAASTFYSVRLQNLTDGGDTGTGTVTGIDESIYNALNGSGAYGFFQTISPNANESTLSGLQVNSVTITSP